MQRHSLSPRPNWKDKVEQVGLSFHSSPLGPYWDESAYYELTADEVDELESAANALHALCIDAAEAIIKNRWWSRLAIPVAAIPAIERSWEEDQFSLYGRFDLSYDGTGPPKLLEYNADTPTALIEASVAQWFWLQDIFPSADQFNSIHERLIGAWQTRTGKIWFSSVKDCLEDEQTIIYLEDTCRQAGLETTRVFVEDIGWDSERKCFVDLSDKKMEVCFKLYPWEWMWHEAFARHLGESSLQFIEPAWKMLLSNKGLLPILWELFPEHPNLLPCFESPRPELGPRFVQKPKLSREGSNITLFEQGRVVEQTPGDYGEEGFVYQALASTEDFTGQHPVMGVWAVAHEAAGLGIREDTRPITGNLSRFVPHLFPPR